MLRLGGSERLAIVRLFYMPPEMEESNPQMAEKFHVCLSLERGDKAVDQRPSQLMLNSTFKGLKPYTDVVYPWREEYRELMKDWVLEDVQYNYGIFGEE
jgi:hypothetical protein